MLWQNCFRQVVNGTNYRIFELILLSVVLPSVILFFKLAPHLLLFLWATLLYCLLVFYLCQLEEERGKYRISVTINIIGFVVVRWLLFSLLLFLFTYFLFPEKLFLIQKTNPGFIWKIILFYPLFSALPQEFIFCKFFFARYRVFFWGKNIYGNDEFPGVLLCSYSFH